MVLVPEVALLAAPTLKSYSSGTLFTPLSLSLNYPLVYFLLGGHGDLTVFSTFHFAMGTFI